MVGKGYDIVTDHRWWLYIFSANRSTSENVDTREDIEIDEKLVDIMDYVGDSSRPVREGSGRNTPVETFECCYWCFSAVKDYCYFRKNFPEAQTNITFDFFFFWHAHKTQHIFPFFVVVVAFRMLTVSFRTRRIPETKQWNSILRNPLIGNIVYLL